MKTCHLHSTPYAQIYLTFGELKLALQTSNICEQGEYVPNKSICLQTLSPL